MATTAIELEKLQDQIKELQRRVAKLEAEARREQGARENAPRTLNSNTEIIALLKSRGLIGEPTREEERLAAEWRALEPKEQAQVIQTLRQIHLGQPVSELIAELRS